MTGLLFTFLEERKRWASGQSLTASHLFAVLEIDDRWAPG